MSLLGIQDSIVKTHLVQQLQARSEDIERTMQQDLARRIQDMARQADEVVLSSRATSSEEEVKEQEERRRREEEQRKKHSLDIIEEEPKEEKKSDNTPHIPALPPLGQPPPPEVGSRKVDFYM